MRDTIEARVRETRAGESLEVGATLRPSMSDDSIADTVAASPARTSPRALPRLSVDLRSSIGALGDASPTTGSTDLEIRGVIGEGGMGRVLLARQHSLHRDVAVKTAKDDASDVVRRALFAEGAITGQLEHPAIVPVHALGIDSGGRPALVMKRIEGVAWGELARDPAHPGWEGWPGDAGDRLPGHVQILMQICNAVRFAHSRGIVHRDIKLENVLIGRFGDAYLADWGVAAPIGQIDRQLCGTPGYMAPEMAGGAAVDERTDVYLLGATLHEILTGSLRHRARTVHEAIVAAWLSEPYGYGPDVPADLAELVNRACHVDPAQRPSSAKELRDALARHLEHRDMAALAREAASRLDRIEALAQIEEPDLAQRAELDRLSAEASFGFERAFASWPGDAVARAARERLEALMATRREHAAALERQAHERDPRVSARTRAVALALFAPVGLAISVLVLVQGREPTPHELVIYPSIMYLAALIGTWTFRKRLRTEFNRQSVVLLHVIILAMIGGRALGLVTELSLADHFARDSFMLATAFVVASIAHLRWIRWVAPWFGVSFVLCTVFPEYALHVFAVAACLATFVAAGFQWFAR